MEVINVGTVLFTESDINRKCWTSEQLALLRAREIFQDIIPKVAPNAFSDDQFILTLLQYFEMCFGKAKGATIGRTQEINIMALADAVGGYLHHIALPLIKQSYYLGNINYDTTDKVETFYKDLKSFLKTDGNNWNCPINYVSKLRQTKQNLDGIPNDFCHDPCEALIVYEDENTFHIPMPFLDSRTNPNSIAFPFQDSPLRNLHSRESAYILAKFYLAATECLSKKNANPQSYQKFETNLNMFIDENLGHLLASETIYPAFGAVHVVKQMVSKTHSAKIRGFNENEPVRAKYQKAGREYESRELSTEQELEMFEESVKTESKLSTAVMFGVAGVIVAIWIIVGIIYCCFLIRRKRRQNKNKKLLLESKGTSEEHMIGCPKKGQHSYAAQQSYTPQPKMPQKSKEAQPSNVAQQSKIEQPSKSKKEAKKDSKMNQPKPSLRNPIECRKNCDMKKCSRQVGFMVESVQSAPIGYLTQSQFLQNFNSTSNPMEANDKPIVFGYEFETSTSDTSSDDSLTETTSETSTTK